MSHFHQDTGSNRSLERHRRSPRCYLDLTARSAQRRSDQGPLPLAVWDLHRVPTLRDTGWRCRPTTRPAADVRTGTEPAVAPSATVACPAWSTCPSSALSSLVILTSRHQRQVPFTHLSPSGRCRSSRHRWQEFLNFLVGRHRGACPGPIPSPRLGDKCPQRPAVACHWSPEPAAQRPGLGTNGDTLLREPPGGPTANRPINATFYATRVGSADLRAVFPACVTRPATLKVEGVRCALALAGDCSPGRSYDSA